MLVLTVISFQKMGLKKKRNTTIKCTLYICFSLAAFSTPFLLSCLPQAAIPGGDEMSDGAAGQGEMASGEANGDPHLSSPRLLQLGGSCKLN